ncbi:hypothetical protein GCM10010517_03130 [Streptosporangium fragile]|uniref:Uncharacterized protein n=1 Tax=Streptosporangium fragile TaxID=46186 RepID=A0ABP6I652_9ACTN
MLDLSQLLLGQIQSMSPECLTSPLEAFFRRVGIGSHGPSVILGSAARMEGPGPNTSTLGVHPDQGVHIVLQKPSEHRDRVHPGSIRFRRRVAGVGEGAGYGGCAVRLRPGALLAGTGPRAARPAGGRRRAGYGGAARRRLTSGSR